MGIIRKTQSVELLLKEFNKETNAISTVELIKRFNQQMNKTTIYRILERLEDDGVLHSFLGLNGVKWYAKCNGCSKANHFDVHPHFQCTDCGKVDCLNINIQIPKLPTREVAFSQVLLHGKCEVCSN